MTDGFHVDLRALTEASNGINHTLSQLVRHKVDTIDGNKSDVGHEGLADTVSDFCDRWQLGVTNLAKDGKAIAAQLVGCVQTYQRVDQDANELISGFLDHATGPDPAGN